MTRPTPPVTSVHDLSPAVAAPWRDFLERFEPLRPDLYRYCRYLARSPWEADDLVQETLMRSFVTLACLHQPVDNPRAWLLRVASNLWLNHVRDAREVATEPSSLAEVRAPLAPDPRATREAVGSLVATLSPQERAAVVLVEAFDLSLNEAAEVLSTSVGTVKSALHRERGKLAAPPPDTRLVPIPAVLDALCDAFNARDVDLVAALLLDDVTFEFPGLALEYGVEAVKRGSLAGVLHGDPSLAIAPAYRDGLLPRAPRLEARAHRGEVLLLAWYAHQDGEAVRAISRVDLAGDRVARLRTYLHAPQTLEEICRELEVPFRSSGYRYWW
jgi:RNA polymerase sigma-70 factor (ECF subfamily)